MNHVDLQQQQQQSQVSQSAHEISEQAKKKRSAVQFGIRGSVVCVGHCVQWPLNLPAVVRPTLTMHLQCIFYFLLASSLLSNAVHLLYSFVAHFTWPVCIIFFFFVFYVLGLLGTHFLFCFCCFRKYNIERILSFFLSSSYS